MDSGDLRNFDLAAAVRIRFTEPGCKRSSRNIWRP